MASQTLVETNIERGRRLIERLDEGQFPVSAALWLYLPEPQKWRLILATRLADEEGPAATYKRLQTVLEQSDIDLPLDEISVIDSNDDLVDLLTSAIATGPEDLTDIRFTANVVNGTFIEDAHIYRMSKPSQGMKRPSGNK